MAPVPVLINMLWPLAFVTQGLAMTLKANAMAKGTVELIHWRTGSENAPATSEAELNEVNSHDQATEVKGSSLEPGLAAAVKANAMAKGTAEHLHSRTGSDAPTTSEAELNEVNSHDQATEVKGSRSEPGTELQKKIKVPVAETGLLQEQSQPYPRQSQESLARDVARQTYSDIEVGRDAVRRANGRYQGAVDLIQNERATKNRIRQDRERLIQDQKRLQEDQQRLIQDQTAAQMSAATPATPGAATPPGQGSLVRQNGRPLNPIIHN